MLNIWIGRAGSGKSRKVLDTIKEQREIRNQILIVPENCSHEAEIDVCRICGSSASIHTEVLTFKSLAIRVLSETGGLSDFTLDSAGKILTLRRCIQELSCDLTVFGKPSQRASFLKELSDTMDEFYAYEIRPERFSNVISSFNGSDSDKFKDIAKIYAMYDSKMHQSEFDCRSLIQKLSEKIVDSSIFVGKDVYFDGFTYFNKQEEAILKNSLVHGHNVTVTLLGEKNNEQEFLNANNEKKRLMDIALELDVPVEIINLRSTPKGPLGHLEKYFFNGDFLYSKPTSAIKLYEAGNAFSEVEYVASEIRKLTLQEGYRYRDIGISMRNLDEYGPIIGAVFHREKLPFYESSRSNIADKPIITFLLSAVSAVTSGFEFKDIFKFLKTGFSNVSDNDVDILENYCITWSIRGKSWTKNNDWTMHPDGYESFSQDDRQRLLTINTIRKTVFNSLQPLFNGLKGLSTVRKKTECLYRFAEDNHLAKKLRDKTEFYRSTGEEQLAEEYGQIWSIFCNILDQFVEIIGDVEVKAEEYYKLLKLVISQYSIGTIPATVDQIKVSSITRNDRHNVKIMFLLGANDSVLPSVQKEKNILSDNNRKSLSGIDINLADSFRNAMDEELQSIYACIAQPRDILYVSYPTVDVSGITLRPSFVVSRIRALFPNISVLKENLDFRYQLKSTAVEYIKDNQSLYDYFSQQDEYENLMNLLNQSKNIDSVRLSKKAIELLYGNSISMSATRLESIKKCHFGFFMEYGLKARERKSATFDASSYGTFIHFVLEHVTKEIEAKGGYVSFPNSELKSIVNQSVNCYINQLLPNFEDKSNRFKYLFYRLKSFAYTIVDDLVQELSKSDFKPLDFELQIGGQNPEVSEIDINHSGQTLKINGKIDRVDGWIHDGKLYVRVVDYKTGNKSFDLTDIKYGLGLQMLLYLFVLEREGQDRYGYPIVPAGVLYMPAQDKLMNVSSNISDEDLAKLRSKEHKRKGLIINNLEVIEAMEHEAIKQSEYLPITIDSNGNIASGVASLEQFGKLSKHIDKVLNNLCEEFGDGRVDAKPLYRSSSSYACQFCRFASACYFVPGVDDVNYMKTCKEEDFWKFIEEENV